MTATNLIVVPENNLDDLLEKHPGNPHKPMNEFKPKIDWRAQSHRNQREIAVLNRKMSTYEERFGKMHRLITEQCARIATSNLGALGLTNTSTFLALRNAIRIMKGKNVWW